MDTPAVTHRPVPLTIGIDLDADLDDDGIRRRTDGPSTLELRYLMTDLMLHSLGQVWLVRDLVEEVEALGIDLGHRPSKRVSDLLRSEISAGRVHRVGWGAYEASGAIPGGTRRRIRARTRAVIADMAHRDGPGADPLPCRR